ncbi:MAG: cell division protein FtsW [Clostridia bacterium]|nr:cell division protein FtsW [Clostridia bacterium]
MAAKSKKKRLRLFALGQSFDLPFLVLLMAVLVIGLICLFSASYVYAYHWYDDSYFFIKRQAIFAVIGLAAMLAASTIDYHILHKFAVPLMPVAWILLLIAYFTPSPTDVHRWINVPVIGQFQPSEVAKFALILLFAHLISLNYKHMKSFTKGFMPLLILLGITCGLVVIEPHLSGTMLLLAIGFVMMYVGGTRIAYLVGVALLGCAAVYVLIGVLGYEMDRIVVWMDPLGTYTDPDLIIDGRTGRDLAWQTVQSLFAVGSGGLMGTGLGNSRQKHLFLPEPQNDFIFAIVCEELGFVGAVLILLLFALLVWRGFVIGMRAKDKFGMLLAVGLSAQIGIQVALNLAVITNLLPNTGISLPFFSYGGSSLVMLLAQMGVILAVSRQSRMQKEEGTE